MGTGYEIRVGSGGRILKEAEKRPQMKKKYERLTVIQISKKEGKKGPRKHGTP